MTSRFWYCSGMGNDPCGCRRQGEEQAAWHASAAVFVNALPLVVIFPGSCHVACSLGWETAAAKGCGAKNAATSRQPNRSVALANALAAWRCRLRRSLVILEICLLTRWSSQDEAQACVCQDF